MHFESFCPQSSINNIHLCLLSIFLVRELDRKNERCLLSSLLVHLFCFFSFFAHHHCIKHPAFHLQAMPTELLTHLPFSSGTLIPFPWGFVPKPTRKKASGAAPSYRRFRNWIVLVSLRMTASAEVPWAREGNLPKLSSVGGSKSKGISTCPKFAVNFRHHTASQRMSLSFLPPGNLRRTFWSLYGLNLIVLIRCEIFGLFVEDKKTVSE